MSKGLINKWHCPFTKGKFEEMNNGKKRKCEKVFFFIFQYIVANSVEERMLTLQDQKRDLISQAFGLETQSQEDRRRARVRDIKHLIGL